MVLFERRLDFDAVKPARDAEYSLPRQQKAHPKQPFAMAFILIGIVMPNLLTLPEVAIKTRLSRSTIYRLLDQGLFPKPRKFSARKIMWIQNDIEEWLMSGGRSNA